MGTVWHLLSRPENLRLPCGYPSHACEGRNNGHGHEIRGTLALHEPGVPLCCTRGNFPLRGNLPARGRRRESACGASGCPHLRRLHHRAGGHSAFLPHQAGEWRANIPDATAAARRVAAEQEFARGNCSNRTRRPTPPGPGLSARLQGPLAHPALIFFVIQARGIAGKYRSSRIDRWWIWCPTVMKASARTVTSFWLATPRRGQASSRKERNSATLALRTSPNSSARSARVRSPNPPFRTKSSCSNAASGV